MSLNGAFGIGRSGLLASQLGMQVAGNNLTNANTPGFSRQRVELATAREIRFGNFRVGRGVDVTNIRRLIDESLAERARGASSQQAAADVERQQLDSLERSLRILDRDADGNSLNLTAQLGRFFDSWSEVAQRPNETAARTAVVEQGRSLASALRQTRQDIASQQETADLQLRNLVNSIDEKLRQVADLNVQIANAGTQTTLGLADRRDQVLTELSGLLDISTVSRDNGVVDVLVGSTRVVEAGSTTGIKLEFELGEDGLQRPILYTSGNVVVTPQSGQIGAILNTREQGTQDLLTKIDQMTRDVIWRVNRVYSTGTSNTPRTSSISDVRFSPSDRPLALNDPANESTRWTGVQRPSSGQVLVRVVNQATGESNQVVVPIDLDGLDATGAAGFGDDTSIDDLAAAFNAVPGLSATINGDGKLAINSATGTRFEFVEDTSGVLAAVGLNSFFTGTGAGDIDVEAELVAGRAPLNVGSRKAGEPVENGLALAIATLRDERSSTLGDTSATEFWNSAMQQTAGKAASAANKAAGAKSVRDALDAQLQGISGVNVDEEAIDLVQYQSMYQASARYISVIQEMTQTLLGILN
jgi:flagellar hook-associated protein 1